MTGMNDAEVGYVMRSIMIMMLLWGSVVYGVERHFSFQSYDLDTGMLRMRLITPSVQGELILQAGKKVELLDNVALENIFTIMARVPCEKLSHRASILWSTAELPVMAAVIPPQTCQPVPKAVLIKHEQGICKIDTNGATLWRVATELSKRNHATIYQNIYAILLTNRAKFKGDDIHELRSTQLVCPSDSIVFGISSQQAKRIFTETLEFKTIL
ncbi:hypothetical protein RA180_21530 [Aeromonas salmonicida]|uniref:hypothetical protein n=1 Tax=Aeromonas salmonicida TaxID=645 RepID=UPI0027967D22|nr:hypothetical protein [Aeromonas salmonicida]MDQ1886574.1 hypothetical protein [Aeromonas salmonicida]